MELPIVRTLVIQSITPWRERAREVVFLPISLRLLQARLAAFEKGHGLAEVIPGE